MCVCVYVCVCVCVWYYVCAFVYVCERVRGWVHWFHVTIGNKKIEKNKFIIATVEVAMQVSSFCGVLRV